MASGDQEGAQEELGDVLFTLVVVGRRLGLEPERALHDANQRFRRRFTLMEERASREAAIECSPRRKLWVLSFQ